jgi:PEP-CTERM motif
MIHFRECLAFVALTLVLCPRALAVVDQEFLPAEWTAEANVGAGNVVDWAQTFTVGITGQLTGFDVSVNRAPVVTQPLLYDIRRTTRGVPTQADSGANILVSGSLSALSIPFEQRNYLLPSLTHVDVSGANLSVAAGDVLAIVLRSDDPGQFGGGQTYAWVGSFPNAPYDRGAPFLRANDDQWAAAAAQLSELAFRTEVTPVPEPATLILILMGFACALGFGRNAGTDVALRTLKV